MQLSLDGHSVLLAVTGSISVYKACEVARLFVKAGANVHVVMSASAERFVSPLTFEALTRNPVLTETSESWSSTLNHIDSGKKCDICVVAPTTANTLNKLSHGMADTILTQTLLAFKGNIVIAPSANTQMLLNPFSQKSLLHLEAQGYTIVQPQEKLLACGDNGSGALAEPSEIFFTTAQKLLQEPFWENTEVIVTGGGTREKIDEVRYLSNFSSGKMAKALCLALYLRGAKVTYLTSMGRDGLPLAIKTKSFEDAQELLALTQDAINNAVQPHTKKPFLFMVAAVADFTPSSPQRGKLKKSTLGESWSVPLKQNPDILSTLTKDAITTIGFKAEMDSQEGLNNAIKLLKAKNVDAVCYNLLEDAKSFGGDSNEITFITPTHIDALGRGLKLPLAFKIVDSAKGVLDASKK